MCYCFRYMVPGGFYESLYKNSKKKGHLLVLLNHGEISRNVHFVAGVDC